MCLRAPAEAPRCRGPLFASPGRTTFFSRSFLLASRPPILRSAWNPRDARLSASPPPSIVHPRDPSSSSSSSPSSTFFSFSRIVSRFSTKRKVSNGTKDSTPVVTYDTMFGARLMDNGNGEEWRNRSQASRGHCCDLFMNIRRTTGGLWPTHPLDGIVDIGQSESRFTEGGAPLFRKRQNWFVQFSPLYDRGLAGREWTQKEEREREKGPPGPPGGEALRRSLFRVSPVYRSALPASPPILLVRVLAFRDDSSLSLSLS